MLYQYVDLVGLLLNAERAEKTDLDDGSRRTKFNCVNYFVLIIVLIVIIRYIEVQSHGMSCKLYKQVCACTDILFRYMISIKSEIMSFEQMLAVRDN